MKTRSFIPPALAVVLIVFSSAQITKAAGAAASQPARPEIEAPAHIAAPVPIRSQLDSEPIAPRSNNPATSGSGSMPRPQGLELPRMAGALALVIALIFAFRWFGKKLFHQGGSSRSTRAIQVLARAPLGPRQHVLLVRVGRRVIVVGDSGAQMNPLTEITDADEIAALLGQLQDEKSALPTKAFSALFHRAKSEMSGGEDEPAIAEESRVTESATAQPESAVDPEIATTRDEITGLMDKIRVLSKNFRSGPV